MKLLLLLLSLAVPASVFAQAQELPLGAPMPLADQAFTTTAGTSQALSSFGGQRGTVIIFWGNRCAWVDRYEQRVLDLANRFTAQGYGFVLVNPDGTPEAAERSRTRATERNYRIPYVTGGSALARALGAQRTPQVFVFDANRSLVYSGTLDDSPSDAAAATQRYLQDALEAGLRGATPATTRSEALGCLIRYDG